MQKVKKKQIHQNQKMFYATLTKYKFFFDISTLLNDEPVILLLT